MSSIRRWALNRADVLLGLVVFALMVAAAIVAILSNTVRTHVMGSGGDGKLAVALLTGWLTIFVAGVGGAVKITSTRQSLTGLFRSEIKALQFGLSTMNMFEFWAKLNANPESGAFGFADTPRKEDYFATYHTVGDNIGSLHPKVLEAVVRFYMYLKMSRDAAASLKSWEKEQDRETRRMHIDYVVQLLTISMLWGFVALWFMGFVAESQDSEFMEKIRKGYDAIKGQGMFSELCSSHVRSAEIIKFFSVR